MIQHRDTPLSLIDRPLTFDPLVYQPLSHPWQTRIVELLPGDFDAELECKLHIADIVAWSGVGIHDGIKSKICSYEALSYSWGRPELTAIITCNTRPLLIPPTMHDALRYLRLTDRSRYLWCDAICINQSDNNEKSSQVQLLLAIFAKAESVIAWLGLPDEQTRSHIRAPDSEEVDINSSTFRPEIRSRPWFQRVWIVQDAWAARRLTFRCGSYTFKDEVFWRFPDSPALTQARAAKVNISRLFDPNSQTKPLSAPDFADCLYRTLKDAASLQATDDRDQVYALLGMIRNMSKPSGDVIQVEYNKTLSETYTDVTKCLNNTTKALDCIHYFPLHTPNPDLPSWIIDWRSEAWYMKSRVYPFQYRELQIALYRAFSPISPARAWASNVLAAGELMLEG